MDSSEVGLIDNQHDIHPEDNSITSNTKLRNDALSFIHMAKAGTIHHDHDSSLIVRPESSSSKKEALSEAEHHPKEEESIAEKLQDGFSLGSNASKYCS